MKILVVDDYKEMEGVYISKIDLFLKDYELSFVSTIEGLDGIKDNEYDLAFLDWNLGVYCGEIAYISDYIHYINALSVCVVTGHVGDLQAIAFVKEYDFKLMSKPMWDQGIKILIDETTLLKDLGEVAQPHKISPRIPESPIQKQ